MWILYNRTFLHGVGTTPRDVVRTAVLNCVAQHLKLDLRSQRDLWNRFVAERLIDEAQKDHKFINCCLRLQE